VVELPNKEYELPMSNDNISQGTLSQVAYLWQLDTAYRNPAPRQHPDALSQGFQPKNPNATYSPAFHVTRGSKYPTQYISMTKSLTVARRWQISGIPIYVIDLSKVNGTIIDLTDDVVRNNLLKHPIANNLAKASAEVLLEGTIPAEAIAGTIS
jgi:hypothetical protein